jgi:hypothetical protein
VHELDRLVGREQLGDRVLPVELVVVELDAARDQAARRQGAVEPAVGLLVLERADQAAHRGPERQHLSRPVRQDALLDRRKRLN